MKTVCTICARGGSKGLPGKNIRSLLGKPLISYSIEQALCSGLFEKVYISTDSAEIAEVAKSYGAIVPFLRPLELAQDETPKLDVINHLIDTLELSGDRFETIVDLDATSPLRDVDDIRQALSCLDSNTDVVITGYKSNKNPYFNMVEVNDEGHAFLSKTTDRLFFTRQSSPLVYALNASIYVWNRESLKKGIWNNKKIKIHEMPIERSIDIDTPVDWRLVELLMSEKIGDNNG